MRLSKKASIMFTAGLLTIATAGGAYAYWTTTGSGSGSAATGTSASVTVAQVGTITAMTPGSAAQAVDFSITNPTTTNQFITSVVVSISAVTGSNITSANPCSASDYTLVQPTVSYGDLTSGSHTYSPSGATLALKNSATNQDGCKDATVALAFNAS